VTDDALQRADDVPATQQVRFNRSSHRTPRVLVIRIGEPPTAYYRR